MQQLDNTVENSKPSVHSKFGQVCSIYDRRMIQIRCDVGGRIIIFSSTLPYIGCEFREVPTVLFGGSGTKKTQLSFFRWGCDTTTLVLYYVLEGRFSFDSEIDWYQLEIDFNTGGPNPVKGVNMLVERWFLCTPKKVRSSERSALPLDDAPVISVQKVRPLRKNSGKRRRCLIGPVVSCTLDRNVLRVMLGDFPNVAFKDDRDDQDLLSFVDKIMARVSTCASHSPQPVLPSVLEPSHDVKLHDSAVFDFDKRAPVCTIDAIESSIDVLDAQKRGLIDKDGYYPSRQRITLREPGCKSDLILSVSDSGIESYDPPACWEEVIDVYKRSQGLILDLGILAPPLGLGA